MKETIYRVTLDHDTKYRKKWLYKTTNKQAAYRFAWGLVDLDQFPNVYEGKRWRTTLVSRGKNK